MSKKEKKINGQSLMSPGQGDLDKSSLTLRVVGGNFMNNNKSKPLAKIILGLINYYVFNSQPIMF